MDTQYGKIVINLTKSRANFQLKRWLKLPCVVDEYM